MSSLIRGSSVVRSVRSGARKCPVSAGGLAANASTRSSATGRTGWMRKIPGLVWAARAQARNSAEATWFRNGTIQCYSIPYGRGAAQKRRARLGPPPHDLSDLSDVIVGIVIVFLGSRLRAELNPFQVLRF